MPIPTKATATRQRPETRSTSQISASAANADGEARSKGDEPTHRKTSGTTTTTPVAANTRPLTRSISKSTSSSIDSRRTRAHDSPSVSKVAPPSRTGPGSSLRLIGQTRQVSASTGTKSSAIASNSRALPTTPATAARNLTSQTLKTKPRSVSQQSQASTAAIREGVPSKKSATHNTDARTNFSAASSHLRDEFLQLQHVHSASASCLRQYRASAEKAVSDKRGRLKEQQDLLLEHEDRENEVSSVKSLDEWLVRDGSTSASDQIQLLSTTVLELQKFKMSSGTVEPLRQFEEWLESVMTLLEERMTLSSIPHDLLFVAPLGPHWSQQINTLLHSLYTIRSSLDGLRDALASSGIGVVLTQHRRFASVMIQEVEMAIQIERTIMQAEVEHEKKELDAVLESDHEEQRVGRQCNGVWTR